MPAPETLPPQTAQELAAQNQNNELFQGQPLLGKSPEISKRSLWAMITTGIGAAIGWVGSEIYIGVKTWEFSGAVENKVREDIMNRQNGIGAALNSAGGAEQCVAPMGNFGPGIASHDLRLAHEYNLAESGKYPFARFIKRFGSTPVVLGTATATGLAAFVGYCALVPKKPEGRSDQPKTDTDWQSRVEADKDQPRTIQ